MRAPRVFSPRWECRQINALFVSFTPRTRVSIAIIEGVTLSLSLSSLPSFFPFPCPRRRRRRRRRWNKCLFVSTTNRLIRPFTRLEISISVTTKGLISLGAVVLVGYYSGSSLSHVTQQWYSSYSGNDYENARVDLAPQETPPKRSNYNSNIYPNLPPSIHCVYIYINFLLDRRSWRDS